MTKKLLFVFPSINPGGAEKAAIMVANKLIETGNYEISFFILDDSQYYSSLISNRINIFQQGIKSEDKKKIQQKYISNYLFGKLLSRVPDLLLYDYIIAVHENEPEIAVYLLKLRSFFSKKNNRTRYISIIQASLFGRKQLAKSVSVKFKMMLINVLRKMFSDYLIAVSTSIKNEFSGKAYQKAVVINNPVDIEYAVSEASNDPDGSTNQRINRLGRYFLSIARIDRQKNNLMLIRAFNEIKSEVNINLLLIGLVYDKELFNEINKFISQNDLTNRVFYFESVENPYIYIKNSVAFVLASSYEGFPLTILEAMALKIPVICSRFIGIENNITEENAIILIENNSTSLAAAMKKVYLGDYDNKKLDIAFNTASRYHINNIAVQYNQFFKSLSV